MKRVKQDHAVALQHALSVLSKHFPDTMSIKQMRDQIARDLPPKLVASLSLIMGIPHVTIHNIGGDMIRSAKIYLDYYDESNEPRRHQETVQLANQGSHRITLRNAYGEIIVKKATKKKQHIATLNAPYRPQLVYSTPVWTTGKRVRITVANVGGPMREQCKVIVTQLGSVLLENHAIQLGMGDKVDLFVKPQPGKLAIWVYGEAERTLQIPAIVEPRLEVKSLTWLNSTLLRMIIINRGGPMAARGELLIKQGSLTLCHRDIQLDVFQEPAEGTHEWRGVITVDLMARNGILCYTLPGSSTVFSAVKVPDEAVDETPASVSA